MSAAHRMRLTADIHLVSLCKLGAFPSVARRCNGCGGSAVVSIPWDKGIACIAQRLSGFHDQPCELDSLVREVLRRANSPRSDSEPHVLDPFHALAALMETVHRDEAFMHAASLLGMNVRLAGLDELDPCAAYGAHSVQDGAPSQTPWDVFDAWFEAGERNAFAGFPTGRERTTLLRSLERLEDRDGGAAFLKPLSVIMWWCHPRAWLPLAGPVMQMLRASDGFGMTERDVPATARDYLALVEFLHAEMDGARIPYRDFLEWWQAAHAGLTLSEGLAEPARSELIEAELIPVLHRLFPDGTSQKAWNVLVGRAREGWDVQIRT